MEKKEYDDMMEYLCEVSNQKQKEINIDTARMRGMLEGMEYMTRHIENYYRSTKNKGE